MRRRASSIRTVHGRVEIARFSGSSQGWLLRFEDNDAGVLIAEVEMSYEQFGEVIGGGSVRVDVKVNVDPERIGRKLENRTVKVPMSSEQAFDRERFEGHLAEAVVAYQITHPDLSPDLGWSASLDSKPNHHRFDASGYEVTFLRWVEH